MRSLDVPLRQYSAAFHRRHFLMRSPLLLASHGSFWLKTGIDRPPTLIYRASTQQRRVRCSTDSRCIIVKRSLPLGWVNASFYSFACASVLCRSTHSVIIRSVPPRFSQHCLRFADGLIIVTICICSLMPKSLFRRLGAYENQA